MHSVSDDDFTIDGWSFGGARTQLQNTGLERFDKRYRNIADYWHAIGFSPTKPIDENQVKDGLSAMALLSHKSSSPIGLTSSGLRAIEAARLMALAYSLVPDVTRDQTANLQPNLGLVVVVADKQTVDGRTNYKTCVSLKDHLFENSMLGGLPHKPGNDALLVSYKTDLLGNEIYDYGKDVEESFKNCARELVASWPGEKSDAQKIAKAWSSGTSKKVNEIPESEAQRSDCSLSNNDKDPAIESLCSANVYDSEGQ